MWVKIKTRTLGFAQQLVRNFKNCGARLARRKSAGISGIFRAFATQSGGMRRCLKWEVIFARALNPPVTDGSLEKDGEIVSAPGFLFLCLIVPDIDPVPWRGSQVANGPPLEGLPDEDLHSITDCL